MPGLRCIMRIDDVKHSESRSEKTATHRMVLHPVRVEASEENTPILRLEMTIFTITVEDPLLIAQLATGTQVCVELAVAPPTDYALSDATAGSKGYFTKQ